MSTALSFLKKGLACATALMGVMLSLGLIVGTRDLTETQFIALSVSTFLFATFSRPWAICILLAAIPLFGNRPGTTQDLALACVLAAFSLPCCIEQLFRGNYRNTFQAQWLFMLYVLASGLSLLALPWQQMTQEMNSVLPVGSALALIPHYLTTELLRGEYSAWHSVKTFACTCFIYQIALSAYAAAKQRPDFIFRASFAALTGLVIALGVGLVDYYGLINLRTLRGLDPVVNPGDVQFRLQSFFGHSGWFAEYVTLCIPTVIVLLATNLGRRLKIAAIVCLLLMGEFVLILTFQRGGWISYPATLLVTWSAIYLLGKPTGATFAQLARNIAPKVLVSLPITVICSISLILILKFFHALPQFEGVSVDAYVDRFEDIAKTSDRTQFMRAGLMLGSTSPIVGLGSESFAFWFRELFKEPSGIFHGTFDLPLYGSAHNVYAQTFAGKGLLGLVMLIAFLTCLIRIAFTSLRKDVTQGAPPPLEAGMLIALCCSFLIYGIVQEIFYVASLEVLVFVLVMIFAARIDQPVTNSQLRFSFASIALLVCTHFILVKVPQTSAETTPFGFGCYFASRRDPNLTQKTWCGPKASYVAQKDGPLTISFGNPFLRLLPSVLKVTAQNQEPIDLPFKPGSSVTLPYQLSKGEILQFETNAYFIPALRKDSADRRILSFQIKQ